MGMATKKLAELLLSYNVFYPYVLIILVIFFYKEILSGFFQQDEWFIFGSIIGGDLSFESILSRLFVPKISHFNPLTDIVTLLEFKLFKLNYVYYAVTSIFLHIITSLLVFLLAKNLFNKRVLAFVASITFALMAGIYQTTSWVVVNHATQGATIFGLLALILLIRFVKARNKKSGYSLFIFSLACLVVSLLFKEITVATFLLFPVIFKIYSHKNLKNKKMYISIVLILASLYILSRLAPVYLSDTTQGVEVLSRSQFKTQVINFLTLPMSGLAQTLAPVDLLILISKGVSSILPVSLTGAPNTIENDIFIYKRVLVVISFIVFLIITIIIFIPHKLLGNDKVKKNIVFGYSFVILNSLIFSISPERSGIMSVVDSRNLYYLSVGSSLMLAGIVGYLASLGKVFGAILFLSILTVNAYFLKEKVADVSANGVTRRNIINDIQGTYVNLPNKVIFYTESDTPFYGVPESEKILPFQSGIGQTLLINYNEVEDFPQEMFLNKFLWGITDQEYKEVEERGFGYFRDLDLLGQTIAEHDLTYSSVIAYRYESSANAVFDISEEVRGRLEGYRAKKGTVNLSKYSLTASDNEQDLVFAGDGKRETKWSTTNPYEVSQSVKVQFDSLHEIAEINIDVYNNKDQNKAGFKVLVSDNGQSWQQIFYSKTVPPDKSGLIKIYLKPIPSLYLRIEQIGQHKYAPWVIHELELYESLEK